MLNTKHEIHGRIYRFALRVLKAVRQLPRTPENNVLIKQVVRSAASIGANASEADGAESKKEFIHQFTISKKEAKETFYWLSLIFDHNTISKEKSSDILDECRQITAILSRIILNAKKSAH